MKKALSIILAILMVVTTVPFTFAAEEDEAVWGTADNLAYSGTLTEAFSAAAGNSEITYIKLNRDIALENELWTEGGSFTLDLNGKNLSYDGGTDSSIWASSITVDMNTEIVLDDTAENKGTISSSGVALSVGHGKAVLKNIDLVGGSHCVNVSSGSSLVVDGATIIGNTYSGIISDSKFEIISGSVSGEEYGISLSSSASEGILSGGEISGKLADVWYMEGTFDLSEYKTIEGLSFYSEMLDLSTSEIRLYDGYFFADEKYNPVDTLYCRTKYIVTNHVHSFENGKCLGCGNECIHSSFAGGKCLDCGAEGELLIVAMTDSYGDGWNGNAIVIEQLVNGDYIEYASATFDSGREADYVLIFSSDEAFVLKWKTGDHSNECNFVITFNGEIVYENSDGSTLADGDVLYETVAHTCDFSGERKYDSEKHWKECADADCDKTAEEAPHNLENGVCDVCEYECHHEKYDLGICVECKYVCPHSFTVFTETVAPKCDEEGLTESVCDYCKIKHEETVPALDHADGDGDKLCDDCQAEIVDVCPDCGYPVHEGEINEYICLLISLIRFIVSLVQVLMA